MVSAVISRLVILVFGTLYPAYASYKAVKSKDVRQYVKWMMYWVVFAFFTAFETFSDIFISWFPFYYEIKILFIIWLLSPATRGSSIIYRKFVHPRLLRHEKDIDKYIEHAKENGYTAMMRVGRQGFTAATDTLVRTALTGQSSLVQTMRRYGSMQELNTQQTQQRTNFVDGPMEYRDLGLRPRDRASWHPADNRPFDPTCDYEILQQQYTASSSRPDAVDGNQPEYRDAAGVYRQSSRLSDDMDSIPEFHVTEDEMSTSFNRASSESNLLLDTSTQDDDTGDVPVVTDYQVSTLPRASSRSTPTHRAGHAATKSARAATSSSSLAKSKGGAAHPTRQRRTRSKAQTTTGTTV